MTAHRTLYAGIEYPFTIRRLSKAEGDDGASCRPPPPLVATSVDRPNRVVVSVRNVEVRHVRRDAKRTDENPGWRISLPLDVPVEPEDNIINPYLALTAAEYATYRYFVAR